MQGNIAMGNNHLSINTTCIATSFSIWLICLIAITSPFLALFAPLGLAPLFIIGAVAPSAIILKKQGFKFIFQSKIYLAVWAYLVFSVVSAAWSVAPKETLALAGRMVFIFLGAACMYEFIRALPREKRILIAQFLLAGFIISIIASNIEIFSDGVISRVFKGPHPKHVYELTDLNRGSSYISILLWPCLAYLLLSGRKAYALALFAVTFLTVLRLESQSAPVALSLAAAAFAFTIFTGRKGISIMMVLAVLAIPAIAITAKIMNPATMFTTLPNIPNSASEYRLYIWDFAAEKAYEKPFFGWGFNAARSFPVKESEFVLGGRHPMPLHPHNNILQIWLETGIVGLVIFAAFLLSLMQRVKDVPSIYIAPASQAAEKTPLRKNLGAALFIGLIVTYFVIGAIGYGMWQNWWLGSILICLWFMFAACEE
jgi:O-antigen ligase